jgi:hypothetical protein
MPRKISPTQINMMRRCRAQYFFRYEEGIKSPPAMPLVRGRTLDTGLEFNFDHKIKTEEDAPVEDVLDAGSDEFETAFTDLEEKDKKEIDKGEEKDAVLKGLKKYREEKAPTVIKPKATQLYVEKELTPVYILNGYIDLLTELALIDFKYVGKLPAKEPKPDYWLQMALYLYMLADTEDGAPEQAELQYVVAPTKTISHRIKEHEIKQDEKLVQTMIKVFIGDLESGNFPPNRENFLCSKRFCGYWNECEKRFGGKVKD